MMRGMSHGFGGVDRQRSVFVGNISYEVTEEQLKDVFSKVGTVVHLRLVHDRETGKPKGYGFCEYTDIKSAELAIRNLNGFELNGRQLRVDSAAGGERTVEEVQQLQAAREATAATEKEPVYGNECEAGRAPEVISRSIASLPPEKMFELMKQMKDVVRSNPSEAKNLLINNPQLAYALLQAQVVMRIVDPQVAMTMLHREAPAPQGPFHQPPQAQQQQFLQPNKPSSSSFPAPNPPYGGPPPMHHPPQFQPPAFGSGGGPPGGYGRSDSGDYSEADKNNAQLLMQVLNLREDEIALFPPEERAKVLALRNQLRNV